MSVTKLLISPVKIRIFAQKRPNLAFLVILGQALPATLVPCRWIGWWLWRAGYILQDTYLIYVFFLCCVPCYKTKTTHAKS